MKVAAFIPIKLNSQRLPNKNILLLGGKPLCKHIADTLLKVPAIDLTYVFCSEARIAQYMPTEVIYLRRDSELDKDATGILEIIEAFVNAVDADIYILAHATAPFIKPTMISDGLNKVLSGEYDSAFCARREQTFVWFQGFPINYNLSDIPRTQDISPVYVETSSFFVFRKEVFTKHRRRIGFIPYICEVSAIDGIDIDTEDDYEFAKKIIEGRADAENFRLYPA